MVVTQKSI